MHQKILKFLTNGISLITVLSFSQISAIDPMIPINLGDIAILNINGSDYPCITSLIRKNEAITVMQNAEKIYYHI